MLEVTDKCTKCKLWLDFNEDFFKRQFRLNPLLERCEFFKFARIFVQGPEFTLAVFFLEEILFDAEFHTQIWFSGCLNFFYCKHNVCKQKLEMAVTLAIRL